KTPKVGSLTSTIMAHSQNLTGLTERLSPSTACSRLRDFVTNSFIPIFSFMNRSENGFKARQLTFPRVRAAYENNEAQIAALLQKNSINIGDFSVYLRAFKQEKEIELWVNESS